ncbi:plasmid pRiA4b ORF-3 family protein [Limnoglobus roseus]|uniref:Plasmid pRiA4b ORF-3 family protein n=1 Tax=Limnoglobus roseus TaxID=2598579 RepID=A0A5C1AF59_9BACT|nr:plasmid pRiA4b ORF-3 family protein [Limnoglobus roseus]QEL16863.1 plasmid pRiA4b ORF-3 family protein [Limnoglobus roseus]
MTEHDSEATATLALTARQRETLLAFDPYFRTLHDRLVGLEGNVRGIVVTTAELADLAADLEDLADVARAPHARRLAAVRRRVDACRERRQKTDNWFAAATAPPPPREPIPGLVFQFRVTLLGVDPPVWRTLLVEDDDLYAFHHAIRTAMGWTQDVERHRFDVGGRCFGPWTGYGNDGPHGCEDERAAYVSDVFGDGKAAAGAWVYDLTADWRHELLLEAVVPWDFDIDYPTCLGGEGACPREGACPPETAGGPGLDRPVLDEDEPLPAIAVGDLAVERQAFDPAAVNSRLTDLPGQVYRWRQGWIG